MAAQAKTVESIDVDVAKPSRTPLAVNTRLSHLKKDASDIVSAPVKKKKLRVAIVTENFLPKIDGVTNSLARLMQHLQAEGHECIIVGPKSDLKTYAGFEVVGAPGIPFPWYKGLKMSFCTPHVIQRLRAFNPDVIQFVDPVFFCAQCLPIIEFYFPKVPLLASYHTNIALYCRLFGLPPIVTPMMIMYQRLLFGRCQLTFCPSPSTAAVLSRQGYQNLRFWPRGADLDLYTPEKRSKELRESWGAKNDDHVVYLYVGRVSYEKNLGLVLQSYAELKKRNKKPSSLVIVGDGPARRDIEKYTESLGLRLDKDVFFLGYRKGNDLAITYASSDIFVFPSWTETFGQVVLEARASGLPVVGLWAEGVCDLVTDGVTGLLMDLHNLDPSKPHVETDASMRHSLPSNIWTLFKPGTRTFHQAVHVYSGLMETLLDDSKLRRKMSQLTRATAGSRSWSQACELLVDGYRELNLVGRVVPNYFGGNKTASTKDGKTQNASTHSHTSFWSILVLISQILLVVYILFALVSLVYSHHNVTAVLTDA